MAGRVWLLSCHVAARWVHSLCMKTSASGHILASDLALVAEACDCICDKRMEARMPHKERAAAAKLRSTAKLALQHIHASRENNSEHLYAVPCFNDKGELNMPAGAQLPLGRWQQSWTEWQTVTAKLMWGVCSHNNVPSMPALLQQLTGLLHEADASLPRLAELEQAWLHFTCGTGGAAAHQAPAHSAAPLAAYTPSAAAGGGSSSPGSDDSNSDSDTVAAATAAQATASAKGTSRRRAAGRKAGVAAAASKRSAIQQAETSSESEEDDTAATPAPRKPLTFAQVFGTKRHADADTDSSSDDDDSGSGSGSDTPAPAKAVAAPAPRGKRARAKAATADHSSGDSSSDSDTSAEGSRGDLSRSRRSSRLESAPPSRPRRRARQPPPRKAARKTQEQPAAPSQPDTQGRESDSDQSDVESITEQEAVASGGGGSPAPQAPPPTKAEPAKQDSDSDSDGDKIEVVDLPKAESTRAMRAADTPLTAAGVITGGGAHTVEGAEELFRVFDRLELSAQRPGVALHRQRGPRSGDASRKAWSQEEVALLGEGLEDFGWGKWSAIDAAKGFRARGRNPADLRSKARQLAKAGQLDTAAIRNFPGGEMA